MEVYLDNSATTKCFESAAGLVKKVLCDDYGNASSMHQKGAQAEQYIRQTKAIIAKTLKINEKEIFFTSGGTEADNLAIIGAARANHRAGRHLIATKIEHPAVLQPMKYLESQGFEISLLPVDKTGRIRLEDLKQALRPDTVLVSIMHTNNEIGSVQPIEEAGRLIKKCSPAALFHVDAVQGFGKFRIYPKKMQIDLLSASGHKIHGPKGVGFLYIDEKAKVHPTVFGGGQQKGMRSGTENVPGIAGLGVAVEEMHARLEQDVENLYRLRNAFIRRLMAIPDVTVNGPAGCEGAPHIVSVSIRGIKSEVMLHALEEKGIYVSAGSACAAKKTALSATLQAAGVEKALLDSTLRFSFSIFTTMEEIDYALGTMYDMIPMLRKYTRH